MTETKLCLGQNPAYRFTVFFNINQFKCVSICYLYRNHWVRLRVIGNLLIYSNKTVISGILDLKLLLPTMIVDEKIILYKLRLF